MADRYEFTFKFRGATPKGASRVVSNMSDTKASKGLLKAELD